MKTSVFDMRQNPAGQSLPVEPIRDPLTAVVVMGSTITFFFNRTVLNIRKAKPMPPPYQNSEPVPITLTTEGEQTTVMFFVSTGAWLAPEPMETTAAEADQKLIRQLRGQHFKEVRVYPDGLTVEFDEFLFGVTAKEWALARILDLDPTGETAAEC
jgi:hypothetical protein